MNALSTADLWYIKGVETWVLEIERPRFKSGLCYLLAL